MAQGDAALAPRQLAAAVGPEAAGKPCSICGARSAVQTINPPPVYYCVVCAASSDEQMVYAAGHANRNSDDPGAARVFEWDHPLIPGTVERPMPREHSFANSCRICARFFRHFALECESCNYWPPQFYRICIACRQDNCHQDHVLKFVRL